MGFLTHNTRVPINGKTPTAEEQGLHSTKGIENISCTGTIYNYDVYSISEMSWYKIRFKDSVS